jgi:hypothetical protein
MALRELLAERRSAVCARWLDAVLGEYGEVTASRWRRERDPFANPVGHALATGLPELLDAVAGDAEPAAGAVAALEAIVRIRAVQDMAPSRAVGFVYLLRAAIREELSAELAGGELAAGLPAVDGRIERLALLAFDAYVRLREQVFRVRQEELKRSVASLLRRWNQSSWGDEAPPDPPLAPGQPRPAAAPALAANGPDGVVRLSPPKDPDARR